MRLFWRGDADRRGGISGSNGNWVHDESAGNGSVKGNGNGAAHGNGAAMAAILQDRAERRRVDDQAEPSLLLTYDGWMIGHIVHAERRVLDALASPTLEVVSAGEVRHVDRDEVLMVVPPPLTAVSPLRIAKQPIPVSVDVGVGTLRGEIHVLPGVSPWETWQRSTSGFVAVTDAALDFPDGTTETAEVVLVSRHAAHSGLQN